MTASYTEPPRILPIQDRCDVIVCGGGPAGVVAAIAAARMGARTRLIELHGCLGGIWTAGLLSWALDCNDKSGIFLEIKDRLRRRNAGYTARHGNLIADVEAMKYTLETMCLEAGVKVHLHTRVAGAVSNADNRLELVITESKSGRQAWAADAFVDATGDGDLAALAGCAFDFGRKTDGATQPMSLCALLTGVRADDIRQFNNTLAPLDSVSPKKKLLAELHRAGFDPSYQDPCLLHIHDDLYILMANHEYGVSALDAEEISRATMHARAENIKLAEALRNLGGVWKNLRLVATAAQIGVREGRRIRGRYLVTQEDVLSGQAHPDSICRVTFGIDIHSPVAASSKDYDRNHGIARPYDIPLRALIAQDRTALLLAGRCISGDHIAHASYRVTGNAVMMGQAAGIAAALSSSQHCLPHELSWHDVSAAIAAVGRPPSSPAA